VCLGFADIDQVGDRREVFGVSGHERHPVDVRGGGDHEVYGASPGLAAAVVDRCCQPAPFARDVGVDGQWVEGGLDYPEACRSSGTLVV